MNPRHASVAARAEFRCEYCRAPEALFNFEFEVEHIIPRGRDGPDAQTNWALACRSCNSRKSTFTEGTDPETKATTRLYNPRTDSWDEHFHVELELGSIAGTTAIGRATIRRLAMNGAVQVSARRQWIRIGLFP